MFKKLSYILFICLLMISHAAFAQTDSTKQDGSNISAVVKMGGLSPGVGFSYTLGAKSHLRILGFFTAKTGGANQYLVDVSYIRNWDIGQSFNPYWGVNLNYQFRDPIIGPGLLLGASYNLSEDFVVYGEAGLNIYMIDGQDTRIVNLFNSGVGVKVYL